MQKKYCEETLSGWRLPTQGEMQKICKESVSLGIPEKRILTSTLRSKAVGVYVNSETCYVNGTWKWSIVDWIMCVR